MKRRILTLAAGVLVLVSCSEQFNAVRALQGGVLAAQALTLSDAQVQSYVSQYVTQLDAQSTVLSGTNAYAVRLRKLTAGLNEVEGTPLNFKVYKTNDVNAFACVDGSVRVYTGLMDIMTDNELLGVIGHEIGHVALKHTKKEMQTALLTNAALEGLASTGDVAATLTESQFGAIGNAILNAQYSKKQESAADDYGYSFLKSAGKNPWAMCMSLEKLQQVAGGSSAQSSLVNTLFSSHPDTKTRIKRMSERAVKEGYQRP